MTNQIPTSEYLQRQLVDMIELAKSTGTNAVEFVQAQAPDVVKQIIAWEVWLFGILAVAMVAVFLVCFVWRSKTKDWGDDGFNHVFSVFTQVAAAVFFVVFLVQATKPLVAPKLFLIEYSARLVRGR